MKKYFLYILFFILPEIDLSQPGFSWAKQFVGSAYTSCHDIASDQFGNVYSVGYFNNTVDFDPGPSTYYLTSSGLEDIFITKMNPAGNFVWAKRFGGLSFDRGYSISIDKDCNVYTTGYFIGTADFDPGIGVYNLTSFGNYESMDAFVSKLDSSGNFVWAKQFGGPNGHDEGSCLTVDAIGDVYIAGDFIDTVDFDPGPGIVNLISSVSAYNLFACKLSSSGNLVWARKLSSAEAYAWDIGVDAAKNVYTTGRYKGTGDFDPGAPSINLYSAGYDDIFISKLNAFGNFAWAKSVGSNNFDCASSLVLDSYQNLYITGCFRDTVDFDPGSGTYYLSSFGYSDIFIAKYDLSCNLIWAKQMGGFANDAGASITVDKRGNVLSAGVADGTADLDPDPVTNFTSSGTYVCELDPNGNFICAGQLDGNNDPYGISVDINDNVFLSGQFVGNCDFDLGPSNYNLTSSLSYGGFVGKYSNCLLNTAERELSENIEINIFPNPSEGLFKISMANEFSSVKISVYDVLGNCLWYKDCSLDVSPIIDLSYATKGIYFLEILSGNEKVLKKIVIQ